MSLKSMLYTSDNESLQQKELSTDINTDLSKLCSQEIKKYIRMHHIVTQKELNDKVGDIKELQQKLKTDNEQLLSDIHYDQKTMQNYIDRIGFDTKLEFKKL
ncbi:MAG: hypothetical protein IJU79_00240 [Desulfovibrionaceae bacterium]|nr:hypothetical protein [Desulfovibrionaceae bacterium]